MNFHDGSQFDNLPEDWSVRIARDPSRVQHCRIVRIADEADWFDIGSKFESSIPLNEWENENLPRVDDKFQVMIDDDLNIADRPLKIIRVEVRTTPCLYIWEDFAIGERCLGEVTHKVSDGFLVNIGVNAFLPQADAPRDWQLNPTTMIGQKIRCRITLIEKEQLIICVAIDDENAI